MDNLQGFNPTLDELYSVIGRLTVANLNLQQNLNSAEEFIENSANTAIPLPASSIEDVQGVDSIAENGTAEPEYDDAIGVGACCAGATGQPYNESDSGATNEPVDEDAFLSYLLQMFPGAQIIRL